MKSSYGGRLSGQLAHPQVQEVQALSFASPALGSCRVPAPALEPGTRQHAAALACNSAFAGQLRKRQRLFASQVRQVRAKRARRPQGTPGALPDYLLPVVIMIYHCNGRRLTIVSCCSRFSAARPTWLGAQSWRIHGEHTDTITCNLFCLFLLHAFRPYCWQRTSAR